MNYLAITLLILVITIVLLLIYIGVFTPIHIRVSKPPFPIGGHYFYKFYQTIYRDAGQAFRAIDKLPLKKSFQRLGIYYDDPKAVEEGMTRFTVGIVMSDEEFDSELASTMESVGFQHTKLPNVDSIVITSFPLRSILSILVAVSRVYPKMIQFIKDEKLKAHPCMEYYPSSSLVYFVNPLEKNDLFYVPEYNETPVEYIDGRDE